MTDSEVLRWTFDKQLTLIKDHFSFVTKMSFADYQLGKTEKLCLYLLPGQDDVREGR